MELEIIFTFKEMPQEIVTMPILDSLLNSKKLFFHYITSQLTKKEKQSLVKISCCIYGSNFSLPDKHWYNKTNGKFWDNEIPELILQLYGLQCTYEPINK